MKKSKVLFVDDEQYILGSLKRMLNEKEDVWELYFIDNVEEALIKIKEVKFDVILSDVSMSGKDGLDLLRELKQSEYQNIPVIMFTGDDDSKLKSIALDLGAHDLLNKPIKESELVARINSSLKIKFYEDELGRKNKELDEQVQRLQKIELTGIMAASCVHDLNNFLHTIGNVADFLKVHPDSKTLNLDYIIKTNEIAVKLTRQILDFAKNSDSEDCICNVVDVSKQCFNLLRFMIPAMIDLKIEFDENIPNIKMTQTQYSQVFMNLCINSSHAISNNGKIEIQIRNVRSFEPKISGSDKKFIKIVISDTGSGMNDAVLKNIFTPFYSTKKEKGTGLGLSTVKRIIDSNNAFIEVKSRIGEGTVFEILIPVIS